MLDYFFYYIVIVNALALYLMYADKKRAQKGEYRISEKTLWLVAFFGGTFGATLGMNWFHHKTKHSSFKWGLPALSMLYIALVIFVILY